MRNLVTTIILIFSVFSLMGQTKTEIATTDIAKPISDYLNRNMQGYSLDKAFRVDTQGTLTFEICISKEKILEKLTFDKDGKYLKKEVCGSECWKTSFREPNPTRVPNTKKEKPVQIK